jgi:hypothetical protein
MAAPYDYSSVVPQQSIYAGFMSGVQVAQAERAAKMQEQRKQQFLAGLSDAGKNFSKIQDLLGQFPEYREDITKQASALSELDQARVKTELLPAFAALYQGKPEVALNVLKNYEMMYANAEDPRSEEFRALRTLVETDSEAAFASLAPFIISLPDGKDIVANLQDARTAAKYPDWVEERAAALSKAKSEAEISEIKAKYEERRLQAEIQDKIKSLEDGGFEVQSSQILSDGTTVFAGKRGERRVLDAEGNLVTGPDAAVAIRKAAEFGAEVQGLREFQRGAAAAGVKEGQKAFDALGKVRANISNIDNAINAIRNGATTGVIAEKFPDWKASTIELRNIQQQLGLDVIGSVTFGALSEGELRLALDTALPTNLSPPALEKWLSDKKAAQQKLAAYLMKQAQFLLGGGTLAEWLQTGGSIAPQAAPAAPARGGGAGGFRVIGTRPTQGR